MPSITNVSPTSTSANAASNAGPQTLTVTGTGFVTVSAVQLTGTGLAGVVYTSSTQLTVPIPATQLAASASYTITVVNPTPGGGTSNAVSFNVTPPNPTVSALAPSTAAALSGGFVLQVSATNVMQNSVLKWGPYLLDTTLKTPAASAGGVAVLSAPINNSLIASAGSAQVTVMNPNADGSSGPTATATFSVTGPTAQPACLLAGTRNYAFLLNGTDSNGAASMIGSFAVDTSNNAILNNGLPNIINSFADFKDPIMLAEVDATGVQGRLSGGAGSCVDTAGTPNTGTVTFAVKGLAGQFTLKYGLRANGNGGRLVASNPTLGLNAVGTIEVQSCARNCGPPGVSLAFGLVGRNDANARYAIAGAMCSTTPISFLQADFADNGATASATASASGASWGMGDATTARAKSTAMTFTTGTTNRPLTLTAYYPYIMDSTPVATSKQILAGRVSGWARGGSCLATGQLGSFDNTAVNWSVFTLHGEAPGTVTAGVGVLGSVTPGGGGGCPAGSGSATLTADFNSGGTLRSMSGIPACYTVSKQGRGVLTYTAPGSPAASTSVFYLDGFGTAYVIGQSADIPFGEAQSQGVNLSINGGEYAFGPGRVLTGGTPPIADVTIDSILMSFTTASGGSNSIGPYVLNPTTGRGTLTVNNATTFGDTQLVFYVVRPRTIRIMGTTATTPIVGDLVQ